MQQCQNVSNPIKTKQKWTNETYELWDIKLFNNIQKNKIIIIN